VRFKMIPNVAERTQKLSEAVDFYSNVLGFTIRPANSGYADLNATPLNLFIIENHEISGPVMELFVDDIEQVRDELLTRECKVLRWRGKGHDCYIQDPFGVVFNLWESSDSD